MRLKWNICNKRCYNRRCAGSDCKCVLCIPKFDLGGGGRLIYILRAKCEPIASSIGVKR